MLNNSINILAAVHDLMELAMVKLSSLTSDEQCKYYLL